MSDGISKMNQEYTYYNYLCTECDEDPISMYDQKWISHLEELEERLKNAEV